MVHSNVTDLKQGMRDARSAPPIRLAVGVKEASGDRNLRACWKRRVETLR